MALVAKVVQSAVGYESEVRPEIMAYPWLPATQKHTRIWGLALSSSVRCVGHGVRIHSVDHA
jgi:hypothetical protein